LDIKLNKNLILTGMMGVGKSTIGLKLAKKLEFTFIDIDKIIETREGCSINQVFKSKGEIYFRKMETNTTLQELKKINSVISLGGGAFLNSSIRKYVKKFSKCFWLDININELIKRLERNKKRPLLHKKNINETVKQIYIERKKTYSEADYKIKCDTLKPEEIVNKILKLYEKSGNKI
jgi:shikimate kinase